MTNHTVLHVSPEKEAAEILAESGTIRAVINLGNPVLARREDDGSPGGITVRIARKIARHLDLELELIAINHARDSFELLKQDKADIGFLAIDPQRSEHIAFSAPYITIEGTYLVASNSPVLKASDVDQTSLRIASSSGSAYDLHLQRTLTRVQIIAVPSFEESLELLRAGDVDAVAGIRQALASVSDTDAAWRVLPDGFMEIRQAVCVPKSKERAIGFLNKYLDSFAISTEDD